MRMSKERLYDKSQTARRMHWLIKKFNGDLSNIYVKKSGYKIALSELPIKDFFDIVRKIPYRKDLHNIEIVQRPSHTLTMGMLMGADCKKKSILMASYLENNGIPYRLIGSSKYKHKKVHHVFPQGNMNGRWINFDATYEDYRAGAPKKITKAIIL